MSDNFKDERESLSNMIYDTKLGAYVSEDGNEVFRPTMYGDGTGAKYDYYGNVKDGDLNKPHTGTHLKTDLQENWTSDTHNEDKTEWESNSGKGCYLTTACIQHYSSEFDDNCEELTVLRWFRDNFVSKDDIEYYYTVAPDIVKAIDNIDNSEALYNYIYCFVVLPCVNAIKRSDYSFAYDRYKSSILSLEQQLLLTASLTSDINKQKKIIYKSNKI